MRCIGIGDPSSCLENSWNWDLNRHLCDFVCHFSFSRKLFVNSLCWISVFLFPVFFFLTVSLQFSTVFDFLTRIWAVQGKTWTFGVPWFCMRKTTLPQYFNLNMQALIALGRSKLIQLLQNEIVYYTFFCTGTEIKMWFDDFSFQRPRLEIKIHCSAEIHASLFMFLQNDQLNYAEVWNWVIHQSQVVNRYSW
jgi:hypothetical protein